MVLFCREVDRNSGKVAVYPLKTKVTDKTLTVLKLRACFNPELSYFVTMKANYKDNKDLVHKFLQNINLSDEMLHACSSKIGCGIERV